jgi:F-type H+-transporting ATPase subunit delta
MSKEIVAARYALALFQIANETNTIDQVEEELILVQTVTKDNPELLNVLTHPKVLLEKKKSILSEAFASLSQPVLNTLLILVERQRINVIPELAGHFMKLANEKRGTEDATVYSVRLLKQDELSALSDTFAKKIGKTSLRLRNVIDQDLIGGVKLRIGNRIYDGSISGKLERIERQLVAKRS